MLARAYAPQRTTASFLVTRAVTCRMQTLPRCPVLSRLSVQLTGKSHECHDHSHVNWQLLHTAELDLNVLTPCTPMHSICRMPWGLPISIPESRQTICRTAARRFNTHSPQLLASAESAVRTVILSNCYERVFTCQSACTLHSSPRWLIPGLCSKRKWLQLLQLCSTLV
jgi:hypothetical protein